MPADARPDDGRVRDDVRGGVSGECGKAAVQARSVWDPTATQGPGEDATLPGAGGGNRSGVFGRRCCSSW